MIAEITEPAREALTILRDGSTFSWSTVTLLGLVVYVYSVEVERRRCRASGDRQDLRPGR
jgi:hypothetical protein